ncbi:uncharacterized protein [Epargyreus clarus]|uniref:uncharacterized protein isoform X2 n=1 Tax=Epargyreus clarus TaxID=520877 RepID=UPI003C2C3994
MASEDVIELGSSEDEAEPPPKKKKPALNAMVHFPNKVPGLVIKQTKPVIPPLQKVLAGGAITITNIKSGKVSPQVHKVKPNGSRPLQKFPQKHLPKTTTLRPLYRPIQIQNNLSINPMSFIKGHQPVRNPGPKLNLPPGITVKRTADQKALPGASLSRQNIRKKPPEKIITTVELDDEAEPIPSGTSPQWYLRPEEQTEQKDDEKKANDKEDKQDSPVETENTMELENNKEPDTSKFIEITIDDSPIKPVQTKRAREVGFEIPITIDDSPVKAATKEPNVSENDSDKQSISMPQSKKKLDYPQEDGDSAPMETQHVIEIDLEKSICSQDVSDKAVDEKTEVAENKNKEKIQEPEATTIKRAQTVHLTQEVRKDDKSNEPTPDTDNSEFHPVYRSFINLCFQLENSDDMRKIVEKKIKTYYRQCPKEYVESEEFIDMVSGKIFAMKAGPDKMYLYIKDIVDELNLQRKTAKAGEVLNKENKEKGTKYFGADDAEYDSKRRRQIRKLEKTIKKLHRAVQKLEEQEVEFEDEEDSVYLLTERYKERLIRVHAKFCQLTNTKMPSEPRIQIEARPGRPIGPAKRLEKWVNRKVPIGTPLPFPDFHDVLRCVRDANDEDRLGWNEADIMEEARDLFTRCGKKLQRRRQENEWRIAVSRISNDVSTLDPAEASDDLKKRLEENKTLASKKETELLNKYADKQNQLKLVAEEIGDKEADESPVESEDDEANDDSNSLEDKQKRKERLRRLLHEKTKKMSAEKENISANEPKVDNKEAEVKEAVETSTEKTEGKLSTIPEKIENDKKEEEIQEVIKDTESEVVNDDTIKSITEEATPSTDEKQEKSIDDETFDVDSDIDELHLLQKLYSENEINSSHDSDSDTPIAISDTLDSDSDTGNNKKQQDFDIISIENSSYSESEMTKEERSKEAESESAKEKRIDGLLLQNAEIELPSMPKNKVIDYDENILLASSDEEKDNTDTHLETLEVNNSTILSTATILNEDSETNNAEIILDEEMSEENNMEVDQVITDNEEQISEPHEVITDDNSVIEDDGKNDDKNEQDDLDNDENFEIDKSMSTDIVHKNEDIQDNDSTSQDVIISDVRGSEQNHRQNDEDITCETDDNNCNDSSCAGINIINVESITATKEDISESGKTFQTNNPLQEDDVLHETHVSNTKTVLDERDLSEREVTDDVNMEVDGIEATDSMKQKMIVSDTVKVSGKCV